MRILVTGANGFLGHYLVPALLETGNNVLATGKGNCRLPDIQSGQFDYQELDITDEKQVRQLVEKYQPEVIVHAAAMSKPDECELQQEQTRLVNTLATGYLLDAAAQHHSFFVFISTDFVFDGLRGMYTEQDQPAPVNYYGSSKLAAEALVQQYPYEAAIVRTVLVYGQPLAGRSNILSIVKEKLEAGETYYVVDDQWRTPTYVGDLAAGITAVVMRKAIGTWHLSGDEVLTPYEMACKTAGYLQLDQQLLVRVTADTFSQPAKRPARTGFDISKARRELDYQPVSFEKGLSLTFGEN